MTDRLPILGWDVGGAHLKAVLLNESGEVQAVVQVPCPLWRGIEQLQSARTAVLHQLHLQRHDVQHAVTMTGELADAFADRASGVAAIVTEMQRGGQVWFYAGERWLQAGQAVVQPQRLASANWNASATWLAAQVGEALLVDIGSTTSDLIPLAGGRVVCRGHDDASRLQCSELVYSGVVRTPLMALAPRVPFAGEWTTLAAEHFATSADIYRLLGQLAAEDDQADTADGRSKSVAHSRQRLARMLGQDEADASPGAWLQLAQALRQLQLDQLIQAALRVLSRLEIVPEAPLISAGVGRFLVPALAAALGRSCHDAAEYIVAQAGDPALRLAASKALPAYAVAQLYFSHTGQTPLSTTADGGSLS